MVSLLLIFIVGVGDEHRCLPCVEVVLQRPADDLARRDPTFSVHGFLRCLPCTSAEALAWGESDDPAEAGLIGCRTWASLREMLKPILREVFSGIADASPLSASSP